MRYDITFRSRGGSALVLTLIVVAMLTLGAAAFFERMFAEHQAERVFGRQLQANNLAESGIEYAQALLAQDPEVVMQSGGLYANPSLFQGVLVNDDPTAAYRGRFTIIAPDLTTDGYYGGVRYGLENESSRLNLNTIVLADKQGENTARTLLMALPGMTESIADAILDWIDTDEEARQLGAERDYYTSLPRPYAPRNGPLGSIEELLLVRDVTPALLFGADLNRNGTIDRNEESLTSIDNVDNSMGELDRGWAAYLTLDSSEANIRADGSPKIDVNMDNLEELRKQLAEVFSEEETDFIIAYRQGGAYDGTEPGKQASNVKIDLKQRGNVRLTTVLDLIGVKTRVAKALTPGTSSGGQGNSNFSGGLGAPQSVSSLGGQGGGQNAGLGNSGGNNNSRIVIAPAFPNDPGSMQTYLPKLMENLAVNPAPSIPGRLNINQAPRALVAGVPGLDPIAVEQIIANRDITLGEQQPDQKYETWLLQNRIVTLEQMKQLMPLITSGGSVYRAQVVGFFDEEGSADRVEVVVDATQSPPVVRRRWSLRELGPGYSAEFLGVPLGDELQ